MASSQTDLDLGSGLVSARSGIVRDLARVELPSQLPAELRLFSARLSDASRFCRWPADPAGAGCCWWDTVAARQAAIGEAVERYCANLVPSMLVLASYDELGARGEAAIDPGTLALFSAQQHATPGFPFVPFSGDLRVQWTAGRDLRDGGGRLVPASLVYASHQICAEHAGAPSTNPIPYAGVAAARSLPAAEFAAILELLERDAVTLGWLSARPLPRISVPQPFEALFAGPRSVLRTTLVAFPSEYGVPVVGALVHDLATDRLAIGTACRPDPWHAAMKAVCEAMQLHPILEQLDDPSSALMRHAAAPDGHLHAWRADRAYRLSYAPDLIDVTDLMCQLQLCMDPALHPALLARFHSGPTIRLEAVAAPGPRTHSAILERLAASGMTVVCVDVTTSDVRSLGWHVARVVVPGLLPNTPAAFPALGGARLHAMLDRPDGPANPFLLPIPYA
ncbi:MAG: ribosomal protein methylthiotransferase accessory factor [Solirubrobacteraceae bacterium]|jgi:ribosomal protein S12 methylthiotransferase accessory factor|nr:ribosomal protein methylthiotransferase accessory factor [Solirubrobacteraceae bacterium]